MNLIIIIISELPKEKYTTLRNSIALLIEGVKSGNKFPSYVSENAQYSFISVLEEILKRFKPIQSEDPDIIPWPKPS